MKPITFLADGDTLRIDSPVNLGELRQMKRLFGVLPDNLDEGDPDTLGALVYIAVRRKYPELSETDAVAKVDSLQDISATVDEEQEETPADPQMPAPGGHSSDGEPPAPSS